MDNVLKLGALLETLKSRIEQIDELSNKILEKTPEDGIEDEINDQIADFELKQELYILQRKQSLSQAKNSTPIADSTRNCDTYKIPKISLPSFSGNQLEWLGFFEEFQVAVHNDARMSTITKLRYLKDALKGQAGKAIAGLPMKASSYPEALSILKSRYDDNQKIMDSLMQAILDIEAPTMNATSLLSFYDNIETYVRGLISLGKHETHIGDFVLPIIKRKLPAPVRTQLRRQKDAFSIFRKFQNALFEEIQAIQEGQETETQPTPEPKSSSTFLTRAQPAATCAFCKNSHKAVECTKISDHKLRLDIVNKNNLCYNCLGPHSRNQCPSVFRCLVCNERHHSALHEAFLTRSRSRSPSVERGRRPTRTPSHSPRRSGTPAPTMRQTAMNFTSQTE